MARAPGEVDRYFEDREKSIWTWPDVGGRLIEEYRRTERRARALENVLLPEIDHSLKFIEEQLDAVDQEEAVRVRNAARGH